MKQEPVAYMNPTGLEYKQRSQDFMYNDSLYPKDNNWIPLYTEPQYRELSDLYVEGEIAGWIGYYEGKLASFLFTQEQADSFLINTDPVGQIRPVFTSPKIKPQYRELSDEEIREVCKETDIYFDGVDTYRFARAILKKASEK